MNVWEIDPPEQPRHIIKIVEIDFEVIDTIHLSNAVKTLNINIIDEPTLTGQSPSVHPSMGLDRGFKYLVYFSDGEVARASYETLRRALPHYGQTWDEDA